MKRLSLCAVRARLPRAGAQAARFQAAILADVAGRRGTMHGRIRALRPRMQVAGPALTVEVRPGDNLMIHAAIAIAIARPGDVLVIDEMDFPVFSVGTNPNGPTKNIGGRIGHPVSCGTDTIDQAAAQARGIAVRAAAGANAAAVAEHSLALLLACAKSVVALDARLRAGFWDKATHKSIELHGRTVGLIGLGAIGQRFARMCDAMGMKVIGFDPFAKNVPESIRVVDLATIWRESDAISLHCPLIADNHQMVNATTLAACKRGVLLVNTARGGLIDEAALCEALASGQVASAGLDSFAVEPMTAPHPFHQLPNVVLSPHIGGVTGDAYVNMGVGAARNVLEVLATAPSLTPA